MLDLGNFRIRTESYWYAGNNPDNTRLCHILKKQCPSNSMDTVIARHRSLTPALLSVNETDAHLFPLFFTCDLCVAK